MDDADTQIAALRANGYVVMPQYLQPRELESLQAAARSELAAGAAPLEYEADLQYPGAPPSHAAAGGATIRRLLDAWARAPQFAACATAARLRHWMETYFAEPVCLSRAHHNCIMTKHPLYGSLTGWHRDSRYWSFVREDLVSVWFALGTETVDNGALWFVPGSHTMPLDAQLFDAAKFFRADLAANARLMASAVSPPLQAGDAVFFHSNTLHSAGPNLSDAVKLSLVFTYHGCSNTPLPGTRSAQRAEIPLAPPPHGTAGRSAV